MPHVGAIPVIFVVLAGLISITLSGPAVMHVKQKQVALSTLTIGILILNIFNFVNALIWWSPDERSWWRGQGLCDIEVKLYLGIGQSLIGATASIFKQLSSILDSRKLGAKHSGRTERWHTIFMLVVCYLLPALVMVLHYVIQPNRYQLDRFDGCRVTWDESWLAIVLIWSWYPVVCAVCLYYAFLTTLRLLRYRQESRAILRSPRSKMNQSRFIRLFGLSSVLICCFMPATIGFFVGNIPMEAAQSYTWLATHPADWSKLIVINIDDQAIALDRWMFIISGGLVFAFFGTSNEARVFYGRCAHVSGLTRVFIAVKTLCRRAEWVRQGSSLTSEATSTASPSSLAASGHELPTRTASDF